MLNFVFDLICGVSLSLIIETFKSLYVLVRNCFAGIRNLGNLEELGMGSN